VSAFIKSMRGSDPDAGLYWLARMLEAGEGARFIARRLVILASEDVGMWPTPGDPRRRRRRCAVEYVGLPEAALNLAQAVVHLSVAPKSNSVATGLWQASEAVRDRRTGGADPPPPTRPTGALGCWATARAHVYPHGAPSGVGAAEHLPAEGRGRRFYRPSRHGAEPALYETLRERREKVRSPC
jgi:putative ATPase